MRKLKECVGKKMENGKKLKIFRVIWLVLYIVFISYSILAEQFAFFTLPRPFGFLSVTSMLILGWENSSISILMLLLGFLYLILRILLIIPLLPNCKATRVFVIIELIFTIIDGALSLWFMVIDDNGLFFTLLGYLLMDILLFLLCLFCLWFNKKSRQKEVLDIKKIIDD